MLICVGIFLAILAVTLAVAAAMVGIAVKLAQGRPDAPGAPGAAGPQDLAASPRARLAIGGMGLVPGLFALALGSSILSFVLSPAGDQMHRKGEFGGAGAQVAWPATSAAPRASGDAIVDRP